MTIYNMNTNKHKFNKFNKPLRLGDGRPAATCRARGRAAGDALPVASGAGGGRFAGGGVPGTAGGRVRGAGGRPGEAGVPAWARARGGAGGLPKLDECRVPNHNFLQTF
jgi:hypothetical protein